MKDARLQFTWFTCCLFLLVGCGDPIHDESVFAPDAVALKLTSRSDDTFYEWPMTRDGYIVAKPPQMAYVTSFDQRFSVPDPVTAELVPWSTEGLDDDMLKFLDEAYKPASAELDYQLHLPLESINGPNAFDISADGTRMLVAKPTGLTLYNCESGDKIGDMKWPAKIASAQETINAVRFGGSTKDLLVASDQAIHRIDSEDASVVSVKGCGEPIADWVVTRDDQSMLIRGESGRLFGGDPQLDFFTSYDVGQGLTFDVASLSPDGSRIGVVVDNHARTYFVDNFQIIDLQDNRDIQLDPNISIAFGVSSDVWADGDGLLVKYQKEENVFKHDAYHMFWKPLQVSVTFPSDETMNSCLVVGRRFVAGAEQLVLFDFGPRSRNHSLPSRLDELPIRFAHDAKGGRVAILDSKGLRLAHRPVWLSRDSSLSLENFYRWIDEGKFKQIERMVSIIAQQDRLGFGRTSQDLISLIASTIAARWKYLEQNYPDEAYYQAMQAWLEEGSMFAIVCSCHRDNDVAWEARGTGYANTVSQEGWEIFHERNKSISEQLRRALESEEDMPLEGYSLFIRAELNQNSDLENVDAFCRQATELYPAETSPHSGVAFKLLPQWFGEPGDVISYCLSISKMNEGAAGDLQYAKLVGGIADYVEYSPVNWTSYDPIRIRRGVEEFIRRGDTDMQVMWGLWTQLMQRTQDRPTADLLMEHFLEHLAVPPYAYTHGNRRSMMQPIHSNAQRIRGQ